MNIKKGQSLRYAFTPKSIRDLEIETASYLCPACNQKGNFIAGDRGKMRQLGKIHYYLAALKCKCGFMNMVYFIINNVNGIRPSNCIKTSEAIKDAEENNLLKDYRVEELLTAMAAAGHNEDWDKAFELVNECLAIEPDNPAALYNLGWLNFTTGHLEESYDAYKKVLEVSDEFPSARRNLVPLCKEMGNYEEAIHYAETFLKKYPKDNMIKTLLKDCKDAISEHQAN